MVYRFQCGSLGRVCQSIRNWRGGVRKGVAEALFRCCFFEVCILALYIFLGVLVVPFAMVLGLYKLIRYVFRAGR